MANSSLKPYAELKVKIREYTDEEGKTKGVYQRVGTLLSSPHGSHMAIKMDAIPLSQFKDGTSESWTGWISVFKIEDAPQEIKASEEDKDFNL